MNLQVVSLKGALKTQAPVRQRSALGEITNTLATLRRILRV